MCACPTLCVGRERAGMQCEGHPAKDRSWWGAGGQEETLLSGETEMQDRVCKERERERLRNIYGGTGRGERRCSSVGAMYMRRRCSENFAGMERA